MSFFIILTTSWPIPSAFRGLVRQNYAPMLYPNYQEEAELQAEREWGSPEAGYSLPPAARSSKFWPLRCFKRDVGSLVPEFFGFGESALQTSDHGEDQTRHARYRAEVHKVGTSWVPSS